MTSLGRLSVAAMLIWDQFQPRLGWIGTAIRECTRLQVDTYQSGEIYRPLIYMVAFVRGFLGFVTHVFKMI